MPGRSAVFVLVGVLGFAVQLVSLETMTAGFGVPFVPATALAVELAILHNFLWHERWTWSDRAAVDPAGLWRRLGRFQMTSGLVSIAGNVVATGALVLAAGMPLALANTLAVAACAVLNFMAADRFVFRMAVGAEA